MALRVRERPAASTNSARVGDAVSFVTQVENTGAGVEDVSLYVEDLHHGALHQPLEFPVLLDPPAVQVAPKKRSRVSFAWTADLPEGMDAHTFRGRLVLKRTTDGKLLGEAPLDLYVSRR